MSADFLRFKNKAFAIRLIRSILSGLALGGVVGGILLLLGKREVMAYMPVLSFLLMGFFALFSGAGIFILLKTSEKKIAKRLDEELGLSERLQTMVEFKESDTPMAKVQREDAEDRLANIKTSSYKAKKIWIDISAFVIGMALIVVGIVIKDSREKEPPITVVPFEISDMQIAGINELISYVDSSGMEEMYKTVISSELSKLLEELKAADTEPKMQAALADSITVIALATYDSSSVMEITTALFETSDPMARELARLLNTGYWQEPDWGDYAEKMKDFKESFNFVSDNSSEILEEEKIADIKWKIETLVLKSENALNISGVNENDQLYKTVMNLTKKRTSEEDSFGFSDIKDKADTLSYEEITALVNSMLEESSEKIYSVLALQKVNSNVGEYVLKKLSVLFNVPIPAFERANLKESSTGGESSDDNPSVGGGGVGEGVEYGSNDLVLDPISGKYVEYGTLYSAYNALMIEKLGSEQCSYTEEQKKAIEKYFALLYSGFKDDN